MVSYVFKLRTTGEDEAGGSRFVHAPSGNKAYEGVGGGAVLDVDRVGAILGDSVFDWYPLLLCFVSAPLRLCSAHKTPHTFYHPGVGATCLISVSSRLSYPPPTHSHGRTHLYEQTATTTTTTPHPTHPRAHNVSNAILLMIIAVCVCCFRGYITRI